MSQFGQNPITKADNLDVMSAETNQAVQQLYAVLAPLLGYTLDTFSDSFGVIQRFNQQSKPDIKLYSGKVRAVMPTANWYRVHLYDLGGIVRCQYGSDSVAGPFSAAMVPTLIPDAEVLVAYNHATETGSIISITSTPRTTNTDRSYDSHCQASGVGLHRNNVFREYITGTVDSGGVIDCMAVAMLDSLPGDVDCFSDTGVGWHVDPFLTYMRVNEQCGLFLFYEDQVARLCGEELQLESSVHTEQFRSEYRQTSGFRGYVYSQQQWLGSENNIFSTAAPAFEKSPSPMETLREGREGVFEPTTEAEPNYSYLEYEGATGFGHMEIIRAYISGPSGWSPNIVAKRHMLADGTQIISSAKRIVIAKTPPIPDWYWNPASPRFSVLTSQAGFYASGPGQYQDANGNVIDGERVFIPMNGDFSLEQIIPLPTFNERYLQENAGELGDGFRDVHGRENGSVVSLATMPLACWHDVAFRTSVGFMLEGGNYIHDGNQFDGELFQSPDTVEPVTSDAKFFGDTLSAVTYNNTKAFICLDEFGNIILQAGNTQLAITPNGISLDCDKLTATTDQTWLRASQTFKTTSEDCVTQASNVRVAARRDVQIVSGVSGVGGTLIDCRGAGVIGQYGDDPKGSATAGLSVIARSSLVSLVGSEILIKTGPSDAGINPGTITIDAGGGLGQLISRAQLHRRYSLVGYEDAFGIEPNSVRSINSFTQAATLLQGTARVGGSIICRNFIQAGTGFSTVSGTYQSPSGGLIGRTLDQTSLLGNQASIADQTQERSTQARDSLRDRFSPQQGESNASSAYLRKISFSYTHDFRIHGPRSGNDQLKLASQRITQQSESSSDFAVAYQPRGANKQMRQHPTFLYGEDSDKLVLRRSQAPSSGDLSEPMRPIADIQQVFNLSHRQKPVQNFRLTKVDFGA